MRDAMEDRSLPQDPEIWLQSRGLQAPHGGSAGQLDGGLLHSQLASILAKEVARQIWTAG